MPFAFPAVIAAVLQRVR